MEFLQPALLGGLIAVAGPLLLHLLKQRQSRTIVWGAMQFLEPDEATRRRWQVQDWILLVLRIGMVVALVLVFARPAALLAWPGWWQRTVPRDRVLIIDASYSLTRDLGGQSLQEALRASVADQLQQTVAGDRWWFIEARESPRLLVSQSERIEDIQSALAHLEVPSSSIDWPATLSMAFQEARFEPGRSTEFWIWSDGQKAGWRLDDEAAWLTLQERARLRADSLSLFWGAQPSSPPTGKNFSIGQPQIDRPEALPGWPVTLKAAVTATGSGTTPGQVTVRLRDGLTASLLAEKAVRLDDGGQGVVEFVVRRETVGSQAFRLDILPLDALPVDNTTHIVLQVVPPIPVLLVDGAEEVTDITRRETFFLESALRPHQRDQPTFVVERTTPTQLPTLDGTPPAVIVLANVADLEAAALQKLSEFVASGGQLVWVLGSQTTDDFTQKLVQQKLFPAGLQQRQSRPAKEAAFVNEDSLEPPWLHPFRTSEGGHIAQARFQQWWQFDAALSPASDSPVTVWARLNSGDPWILSQPVGSGQLLVITTPLTAEGSTFPTKPDYVVWCHELMLSLATGRDQRQLTIGQPIPLSDSGTMTLPDGQPRRIRLPPEKTAVRAIPFTETWQAGLYQWLPETPPPASSRAIWAVEADRRESDLQSLSPDDLKTLQERIRLQFPALKQPATATQSSAESDRRRQELAALFLGGVLLLLMAESWWTARLVRRG